MVHFLNFGWFVLPFGFVVNGSFLSFRLGHPSSFFPILSAWSSIIISFLLARYPFFVSFLSAWSSIVHFFPFGWFVLSFGSVVRLFLFFQLGHPFFISFLSLGRPWLISFRSAGSYFLLPGRPIFVSFLSARSSIFRFFPFDSVVHDSFVSIRLVRIFVRLDRSLFISILSAGSPIFRFFPFYLSAWSSNILFFPFS